MDSSLRLMPWRRRARGSIVLFFLDASFRSLVEAIPARGVRVTVVSTSDPAGDACRRSAAAGGRLHRLVDLSRLSAAIRRSGRPACGVPSLCFLSKPVLGVSPMANGIPCLTHEGAGCNIPFANGFCEVIGLGILLGHGSCRKNR